MTGHDEVERLVAVITMDCYNLAEQVTAFYETFAEDARLGRSIQRDGVNC
jgi:hypothetical protein